MSPKRRTRMLTWMLAGGGGACALFGGGACTGTNGGDTGIADTGTPAENPTDTDDTGEVSEQDGSGPVLVLAGGGSEGDEGDDAAWSASLYGALLEPGDVTGDGAVRVAVLSAAEETDWLPGYFEWLGADEAFNLEVSSAEAADDAGLEETFSQVDAVFIKGGDQGEYYDLWNETALESHVREVYEDRGGGMGGTSAGAMSMAQYALAGSRDLISLDVLEDACTEWLDDASDGGSGIHDDFLGFLPGVVVDTHFTQRGRLGRLVGAMARAWDDLSPGTLGGIGLEQATGIVVRDGVATVHGDGTASFVRPTAESTLVREVGMPLVWTDLDLHRLTAGWRFDLEAWEVDTDDPPEDAEAVAWDGSQDAMVEGTWYIYGDLTETEERFAWVVERAPDSYAVREGTKSVYMPGTLGITAAHGSDSRDTNHESLFRALYDTPGAVGFLVGYGGMLDRESDALSQVWALPNPYVAEPDVAALVVDSSEVSWRSLSTEVSPYDVGDASLHAAGLVGLGLHVLADTDERGLAWDMESRAVVEVTP